MLLSAALRVDKLMAEKREFTPAVAETVANCTLVLQLMA
jgi:hypothetical protein